MSPVTQVAGSSGKQAVYQWCNLPGFGGDGQAEKNGAHQDHQGKTQTDYTQRLGKEGAFFTVLSPTAFYNNFRIHSFLLSYRLRIGLCGSRILPLIAPEELTPQKLFRMIDQIFHHSGR